MAYGFRPANHGGYNYQTSGFEEFPIDAASSVKIFNGDIVQLTGDFGVIRNTNTQVPAPLIRVAADNVTAPADQALGIFVGCRYVTAAGTPTWAQYFPGSGDETKAYAQVVTDANAVFKIQGAIAWADTMMGIVLNPTIIADGTPGGDTTTGNSSTNIDLTADANGCLRVIDVVRDGKNELSTNTTPDVLVRWSSPTALIYGYQTAV